MKMNNRAKIPQSRIERQGPRFCARSRRATARKRRAKTASTRAEASRTSRMRPTRYSRAEAAFSISAAVSCCEAGLRRPEVRADQADDRADLGEGVVEGLQVLHEGEEGHVALPVQAKASLRAPVGGDEPLLLPELDRADIDPALLGQLADGEEISAGDEAALLVLDGQADAALDLAGSRRSA